ncbi:MAG: thiamine pyrophosphate-binding protein [Desulfobacterium sp.]|jgi:thiamine pyrophosphate-dependent acetolactate synthase large subunit-like protein|nr:thiamine pyrophosphate-binding protein [Desulfobacterium sp.]
MNGGEKIAQVLKNQGVEFIFTLCGGHISPILVGAKKAGIRVIDVRQEPTAVFAADAVSRLTGTPGVAAVTAGPGVTNSITAIKNAQMAQSPLVLLGGAPATVLKGRGALQDIEQMKLMETLVKWSSTIHQDCDIVPVLEEAFDVAVSGIPGPVFIECPLDLLYDPALVREWYTKGAGDSRGVIDRVTRWYLRRHVDKMFACSAKDLELAEKEEIKPFFVDSDDLEAVLQRIKQAQSPVMVIGSQVALNPRLLHRLSDQLRSFGVPMFLTGMARGLVGDQCAMQFRHGRTPALKEADLILIAGMPCDFRLNYGKSIGKDAFYVGVNRSKTDLRLNLKPDLAVVADPCTFLLKLTSETQFDRHHFTPWINRLNLREKGGTDKIAEYMDAQTEYTNPLRLCAAIDDAMEENSVVIGDGGDFIATASYILKPRGPLAWMDPGPYGTLGVGAGFAIAAKLVHPEAEVWLLYGDGAAGYGLMEQDTFVRHNLPIITVIGNDAGWTQIARDQVEIFHDDVATTLEYSDYHKIADALAADGMVIKDNNEIGKVLADAKQSAIKGRPVLVNAMMGRTDFRKGSISV